MFAITTEGPTFGRGGYFTGFAHGEALFCNSCFDKRIKCYKTRKRAKRQLARIMSMPYVPGFADTAKYEIVTCVGW
jgi:hypothetical protein